MKPQVIQKLKNMATLNANDTLAALTHTLSSMNQDFGVGVVKVIRLDLIDSDPSKGSWCGTVEIAHDNLKYSRYFKVENNFVTYLSRKRKLS